MLTEVWIRVGVKLIVKLPENCTKEQLKQVVTGGLKKGKPALYHFEGDTYIPGQVVDDVLNTDGSDDLSIDL